MTGSIVIDSSVLVSLFLEEDGHHEQAVATICKIFNSPDKPSVIIPPLVLYEIGVATIRASADAKIIANRLYRLINIDQVKTSASHPRHVDCRNGAGL
jgi:predicted nucleic acid-binding protein